MVLLQPIQVSIQFSSDRMIDIYNSYNTKLTGDVLENFVSPPMPSKLPFDYSNVKLGIVAGIEYNSGKNYKLNDNQNTVAWVLLDKGAVDETSSLMSFYGDFRPQVTPTGEDDLMYSVFFASYIQEGKLTQVINHKLDHNKVLGSPDTTEAPGVIPYYFKYGYSEQIMLNYITHQNNFTLPHSVSTQNNLTESKHHPNPPSPPTPKKPKNNTYHVLAIAITVIFLIGLFLIILFKIKGDLISDEHESYFYIFLYGTTFISFILMITFWTLYLE